MTKWKLVPVGVVTPEMTTAFAKVFNVKRQRETFEQVVAAMIEAAPPPPKSEPIAYIEHHKGGDNLVWDNPGGKYSVLYTAPLVMKLSDERILELIRKTDSGRRPWGIGSTEEDAVEFARAIEQELLGE